MGLLLLLSLGTACIQFRPIALYDGQEKEAPLPQPKQISSVVAPILFSDDTTDVWGILSDSCKTFSLESETSYAGDASLHLQWNRQGCEFVGFGMGWDAWTGKNLAPLVPYAAFQFYVRTKEGKAFGLPFVLTLEDYSGVMAFAYTGNKYFERATLDENWQKVQVPLTAFDDEGKGIDLTNIKQLQVECQQSGNVLVDEFSLVFFEPDQPEPWLQPQSPPVVDQLPIVLFSDQFVNDDGWGLQETTCKEIQLTEANRFAGTTALHLSWDFTEEACAFPYFGVNWSNWFPVDVQPILEQEAQLSFYVKTEDVQRLNWRIELEDFDRIRTSLPWNPDWASPARDGWYKVNIPLQYFFDEKYQIRSLGNASAGQTTANVVRLDPKRIKTLAFRLEGKGDLYLDELRWEAPSP